MQGVACFTNSCVRKVTFKHFAISKYNFNVISAMQHAVFVQEVKTYPTNASKQLINNNKKHSTTNSCTYLPRRTCVPRVTSFSWKSFSATNSSSAITLAHECQQRN